jgi:ribonuclease P protein component
VGKSAGNSVQRHRISRQLRHAIAPVLTELPNNSLFVIRALKGASTSDLQNEVAQMVSTLKNKAAKIAARSGAQA